MIRLWPRSIAGRTTLVLIAGMLGVIWLGMTVWWLTVLGETGPPRRWHLVQRIETLASVANRLPTGRRNDVLRAANADDMRAGWFAQGDPTASVARVWFSRRVERRLRRTLALQGIDTVIVGQLSGTDRDFPNLGQDPLVVRIKLSDGTWLHFAAVERSEGPYRLLSFILTILVVAGGLTGLAVWVSRRVTAPLGRFSAAAERLGTDVNAAPLAEAGPTEIRRAAHAFNQMQGRIRRFVDDRTLMLAAISHDLRTSLTRLKLRTEFIDNQEQQRKANADIDEMQTMLAETLAFARDDTLAESTTPVDLVGLLQSLCDDLADSGHTVTFDGPARLPFACRPVALRRAFDNLIRNAAIYASEAAVTLAVGEGDIVVTVADRGPGISADMREKVFAPFFRLEESRSRETGGVGLGLTVARNIVRHHGGDITLDDRPGGGLIARIILPQLSAT